MLNLVSLLEAEFLLSFIGLSYPDPVPTLGGLLRQGITYLSLPMMLVSSLTVGLLIFALLVRFEMRALP
jgi:ABC-type dipeptide/oligopeptide/nickel transport system permease subunit